MRNVAVAVLRQLGFAGRTVAAAMGLTENYVATLHNRALREGTPGLVRERRRPGKLAARGWERAARWRAEGASGSEIARRLRVAQSTVSRRLGPAAAQEQLPGAGPEGEPTATGRPAEAGPQPEPQPAGPQPGGPQAGPPAAPAQEPSPAGELVPAGGGGSRRRAPPGRGRRRRVAQPVCGGGPGLVEVMAVRTWLEAEQVAQGIFRVRSKRVNCYLVRDGSALTLVDTGLPGHCAGD